MASKRKTKRPQEEYDCGIIIACDKGDDDAQLEW
jgi:hypothetical protein